MKRGNDVRLACFCDIRTIIDIGDSDVQKASLQRRARRYTVDLNGRVCSQIAL